MMTAGNPVLIRTDVRQGNISFTTTSYIGPQTVMTGENRATAFVLQPGEILYDTLVTTEVFRTQVYQLQGTTVTADLPGMALIGRNAAGQIEVLDTAPVFSLSQSALPVVFHERAALLGAAGTATRDVGGRLFQLRSGVGTSEPGRWQGFAAGVGASRKQEAANGAPEFVDRVTTGTLGGEVALSPHLKVGFAGTGLRTRGDLGDLGHLDTQGFELSAFGSWTRGRYYFDGLYGYGHFTNDLARNTLLGTTAGARQDAATHSLNLNAGCTFSFEGGLVTGPALGAAFTHGHLAGYSETGANTANVSVRAQNASSLTTDLGWQASFTLPSSAGSWTFQARISWQRENLADDASVHLDLAQSPYLLVDPSGGFTRTGAFGVDAAPASAKGQGWLLGAGMRLALGPDATVLLDGEERLLHAGRQEQFVGLNAVIRF
jgi:uncharacterized protein YhjY with autotransporter beta-barrel domain